MEKDYKKMYQHLMDYEENLHERNQKRIKIGLGCIWVIPLVFLSILFLTDSSKEIFLILWIASLFGIATYLIMVEYTDYKIQKKLKEIRGETNADVDSLIATTNFDVVEERLLSKVEKKENKEKKDKKSKAKNQIEVKEFEEHN